MDLFFIDFDSFRLSQSIVEFDVPAEELLLLEFDASNRTGRRGAGGGGGHGDGDRGGRRERRGEDDDRRRGVLVPGRGTRRQGDHLYAGRALGRRRVIVVGHRHSGVQVAAEVAPLHPGGPLHPAAAHTRRLFRRRRAQFDRLLDENSRGTREDGRLHRIRLLRPAAERQFQIFRFLKQKY